MPVLQLELNPILSPPWYHPHHSAQVPIPPLPIQPLPGEIWVWGKNTRQANTPKIPLLSNDQDTILSQYPWEIWQTYILGEEYRTLKQPLYTRLPFHYHAIPGPLRALAASSLFWLRNRGFQQPDFPGFPIEQGWEIITYLWQAQRQTQPRTPTQITLTHDLDSAAGWDWVLPLAELEMRYGLRSIWHIVARRYPIKTRILDWLVTQGFQLGLHGDNHDGRLIFLSEREMHHRLQRCLPLIQQYQMRSFRSPAWFRSRTLYRVLADYFQTDYSTLDTDIICPGGNGGCFYTKPFILDGILHVPTTIPFEEPLRFGYTYAQLLSFWQPKIDWLIACQGDIVVNTHPEPHFSGNSAGLAAYEQLLQLLQSLQTIHHHLNPY